MVGDAEVHDGPEKTCCKESDRNETIRTSGSNEVHAPCVPDHLDYPVAKRGCYLDSSLQEAARKTGRVTEGSKSDQVVVMKQAQELGLNGDVDEIGKSGIKEGNQVQSTARVAEVSKARRDRGRRALARPRQVVAACQEIRVNSHRRGCAFVETDQDLCSCHEAPSTSEPWNACEHFVVLQAHLQGI